MNRRPDSVEQKDIRARHERAGHIVVV